MVNVEQIVEVMVLHLVLISNLNDPMLAIYLMVLILEHKLCPLVLEVNQCLMVLTIHITII